VGASGAVFGVMGLYLAFFPLNDVRMFYLIWIRAGTFECSSFWMIGLWVGLNILDVAAGTAGNVGVWAHMGGFAVGFGVGLFLLRKGFVERDDYDFFSWIGGRRERKLVARLAEGKAPTEGGVLRSIASAREMCRAARTNLDAGEVEEACEAYGLFAEAYPLMALDEASQLKVANALLHAKDYEKAAEAFVRFARYYPKHAQAADALYSAGILHVHQLSQTEKGCRLLSEALPRLKDAAKAEKARRALSHAAGAQPR
jgi:tetratricopeptide (TPR) repeat protein